MSDAYKQFLEEILSVCKRYENSLSRYKAYQRIKRYAIRQLVYLTIPENVNKKYFYSGIFILSQIVLCVLLLGFGLEFNNTYLIISAIVIFIIQVISTIIVGRWYRKVFRKYKELIIRHAIYK